MLGGIGGLSEFKPQAFSDINKEHPEVFEVEGRNIIRQFAIRNACDVAHLALLGGCGVDVGQGLLSAQMFHLDGCNSPSRWSHVC